MLDIALYMIVFFLVWTIEVFVLIPFGPQISSPFLAQLWSDALRLAIWVLPVFWYLRRFAGVKDRFAALKMRTVGKNLRLWIPAAIGFAALLFALQALAAGAPRPNLPADARGWLLLVLRLPIAPLAAEILFRGFVLGVLQRQQPFWMANVSTAILFTAANWPEWVVFFGQDFVLNASPGVFVFGLFLGYLREKTDSLWPGVGLHILNNLLAALIAFG